MKTSLPQKNRGFTVGVKIIPNNAATAQLLYKSIGEGTLAQSELPSAHCAIGCASQEGVYYVIIK